MSLAPEKPGGRSARLNLLLTDAEKRAIENKAGAAGLTVSDLVRRAALAYEPEVDAEALTDVLDEVAAMTSRVLPKLDAALEEVRASRVTDEDRARWRREALGARRAAS